MARHTAESSDTVFSTANYTLRNDERGNPVWIVSLQTDSGESLGTIHIGTNHGSVTRVEGMFSGGNRKRRELSASFAKRGMKQREFFTTCGVHLPISSEEIDRALIFDAHWHCSPISAKVGPQSLIQSNVKAR